MSAADLLDGYSSEEEENSIIEEQQDIRQSDNTEIDDDLSSLESTSLEHVASFASLISKVDLSDVKNVRRYSQILPVAKKLVVTLSNHSVDDLDDRKEETMFIAHANHILDIVSNEISEINAFIRVHYNPIFPELSTLIPNPVEYSSIVRIIKDDIKSIGSKTQELKEILQGDKMLVVTMSASLLNQSGHLVKLQDFELSLIYESCDLLLELDTERQKITKYISERSSFIAPNVTAIVGPITAAQLLSIHGLQGLTKTPACNLASLGANRAVATGYSGVGNKQKGFLYNCDFIQNVPDDFKTQAIRMVSAKVILASRIDYGTRSSKTATNAHGVKWREEIIDKLTKLYAPPENRGPKPLAVPIDAPSKKRGGRRYRKYKEQFEMSDLAKAQNKMAFGEQEETRMDAFGEEIGLGMIGKFSSGGAYRAIENKEATRAKMSKSMIHRLQQSKLQAPGNNSAANTLIQDERLLKLQEAQASSHQDSSTSKAVNIAQSSDWLLGNRKRAAETHLMASARGVKRTK